ncbi:MAG: DUF262 domain-containing protein, partial [Acidobacteria bacterium]|nr:DUF262 domain-containing protein [Acidobacteriota bacterium]
MPRQTILDANTAYLTDIFSNGRLYRVPAYQRDYSWGEEHWEDLWSDIEALEESDLQHYMGAIVLQESDAELIVIDGQQRLATLSLLALAVLKRLKDLVDSGEESNENQERFDLLQRQYIGSKDPASLRYASRISLNEHDDDFYQQFLIQFRQPLNERKLAESQRLLWQAYKYFTARLAARFPNHTGGSQFAEFLNNIVARRLAFIEIRVQDDVSAYTVFETLNARGLELTESDLLKNYLFSKVAASSLDLLQARSQWNRISDLCGAKDLPVFLRHFLNSRQAYVRKERLFKTIKTGITSREHVFPLLDDIEKAVYLYKALDDPHDEYWQDFQDCRDHVRALNIFQVSQYKPLILACAESSVPAADLCRVLRACVVISFRFNLVGRRNTNELEKAYNEVAVGIHTGDLPRAPAIIRALKHVYIPDAEFAADFETLTWPLSRKRKLVRYVLLTLERLRGGLELDFETDAATVEHILPENPDSGWEYFEEPERERMTFRLGNLTLLERNLNKAAANAAYDQKRDLYASSQFKITRELGALEW